MIDLFGVRARRELRDRAAAYQRDAMDAIQAIPPAIRRQMSAPWRLPALVRCLAAEAADDRAALAVAREDLRAANARADEAERKLAAATDALSTLRDRFKDQAAAINDFEDRVDAAEAENRELRRLVGNARNQLDMAEGTTPRR